MPTRLAIVLFAAKLLAAQPGWWTAEPIRWVQTNLRETDAAVDTHRLVAQLAEMRANVVLMGMGGISAYYPTRVEFHYPSPYLPAGRDMFGDVVKEAHARGIRVVGRYDLSKTQKAVYDAHPEWFFRKADGSPVDLQRPLFHLHQWRILSRPGDEDSRRRPGAIRRGRPVLQYVRQPVHRLQRRLRWPVPLRRLPRQVSQALRPRDSGTRRRGLPQVPAGQRPRGFRGHRQADPRKAAARRLLQLYAGVHRRHHVGVQHRRAAGAAAVALLRQRQRESRAQQPARENCRWISTCSSWISGGALRPSRARRLRRACGRTWPTAAPSRSKSTAHSTCRTGRPTRLRYRSSSGPPPTRINLPACAMPHACCCLPGLRRAATTRIAACSACSPKSTSRSPFPRTWNGSASGLSIW